MISQFLESSVDFVCNETFIVARVAEDDAELLNRVIPVKNVLTSDPSPDLPQTYLPIECPVFVVLGWDVTVLFDAEIRSKQFGVFCSDDRVKFLFCPCIICAFFRLSFITDGS